ncbi:tyrosine-type recombinase/integrase [Reyranella sp.]|uniref:tyrosine-type recombinase/integrase n=1 Tax=Reyranella sp. TaxID=1929291 RepID=UPI003D0CF28B
MAKLVPYSVVKPEAWPPEFRRLLDLRNTPTNPLEMPSVAAGWRATTYEFHIGNVGYFAGWLACTKRLRDVGELREYATSEIIGAYVDDMRSHDLSTRTIANRVDGVRAALAAISPEYRTDWLMRGINRLRLERSDRRRTSQRSRHTADLVALGMSLMNNACHSDSKQNGVTRAISYRDGLIIVFLALAVPRLSPLHAMALDQHLIARGDVYQIKWSAQEMKEGNAYEAQLDRELSHLFRRYVDEFRPILLARDDAIDKTVALWIARDGGQLSCKGIYGIIRKRTNEEFDEPVFPHSFRHSAATSLALERPDLIKLATPLLQHQAETSRDLYVLADKIAASRKFGETLNRRRFRRGKAVL